jgi:hypothetical protein
MKGGNGLMKSKNFVKILGLAAAVIGMGATLISDWVNDRQMDERIDERISEALASKTEEES